MFQNIQSINHETKFYGILGFPLSHTLSPLIHNTLFSEYGINSVYLVFERENPDKYSLLKEREGIIKLQGLSVTIPHKQWAFQIADETDETSLAMQASNTIVLNTEGNINCYNTDGIGAVIAIESAKSNFFSTKKDVLILGSGGGARGISYEILRKNFAGKIVIASRNEETGKAIVNLLNGIKTHSSEFIPLDKIESESKRFSLIIQTTPVGMKGKEGGSLLKEGFLQKNQILFDIVYNPTKTPLVQLALKAGCKIIPGYEMLRYQALEQFRLFTGITVSQRNSKLIQKILEDKLR
ncbi:MAG: shikimate dehydrogenase [Leptospiraceae bacterium]|nr:shikimate dehydrogenase [Leptospiraceae bacterium]